MIESTTKRCYKCGETKIRGDFYKDKSKRDGLNLRCRCCDRIQRAVRYKANWAKEKGTSAAWRKANKDRALATRAAWQKANPEKVAAGAERRAFREAYAPGLPFSRDRLDYQTRIALFAGICGYCKKEAATELDHAIPLSRGGSNWPSNITPACKTCNLSKGSKKLWSEWIPPYARPPESSKNALLSIAVGCSGVVVLPLLRLAA